MPRVLIRKDAYKIKDFTQKVKGKCAERNIKQVELAEELGITQPALSSKMKNGSYTLTEFLTITNYLHFTDDELLKALR